MIPFTQGELDLLYKAAEIAITQIKQPENKTEAEITGAIYTTMRRELAGSPVFPLFKKQKRNFQRRPSDQTRFVESLVEKLMPELEQDQDTIDIRELRLSLSSMRSAQSRMVVCDRDAERIVEKLLDVYKTLDPIGDIDGG